MTPAGQHVLINSMTARLMGCIDDARKHPGLILIAATNFYDGLDRALIREGRFDLHIRLDLPNEEERTRIFEAQLAKRPSRHFNLQPFAKRTPGWSAAKIGTLVDRAAFFAAEEHRKIEERDLTRAFAETGGKDRAAFKEVDWADVVLSPDTEADLRNLCSPDGPRVRRAAQVGHAYRPAADRAPWNRQDDDRSVDCDADETELLPDHGRRHPGQRDGRIGQETRGTICQSEREQPVDHFHRRDRWPVAPQQRFSVAARYPVGGASAQLDQ